MGQGSQAFQGAAGGAMTGAAFGSAIPGIGTGIGAAVGGIAGGLAGYFGNQGQGGYEDQLRQLAAGYGRRTAPKAGPASQAGYSDFRRNQAGLVSQLEAMSQGRGPSAASHLMQEAMDRSAGAQASAAAGAGGRGVNAGAALRQASNNTAAIQAQGARDTGLMRVQEQLGATQQLGQVTAQGRAADENTNQFNAGAQNQVNLANLQAAMQTMGLNDEGQLRALMAAMGLAGPGMGTQLLAGGASAVPGLLQYAQARNGAGQPGAPQGGGGSPFDAVRQSQGSNVSLEGLIGSPDASAPQGSAPPSNPNQWSGFIGPSQGNAYGMVPQLPGMPGWY